jgi:succinate-acetate transporter protein
MGEGIANPKALGFSAFAIVAWMFSLLNVGWFTVSNGDPTMTRFTTLALVALFIAAVASFLRRETWYAVFFMFWAAYIWGLHATLNAQSNTPPGYGAWLALLVAMISFFLLLSAMRAMTGLPVVLLNLGNTAVFVCFALGGWMGAAFWERLAGYIGLAAGLAALWAAWNAYGEIGVEPSAS